MTTSPDNEADKEHDEKPELEKVEHDIDEARRQAQKDGLLPQEEPRHPPSEADAPVPPG
jgi:hypothetical protein